MKQLKLSFLLTILMSMVGVRASAYDAEIDGIYYNFSGTEATVTYRQYGAYHGSYSGNMVIPESVTYGDKTYSVTSIGGYAFRDCSNLTSVTIPNSVTSIGRWAFRGCGGLQKVIVSDIAAWCNISFEDIESNPLFCSHHIYSSEDSEYTELIIPDGVTSISDYAFYGCTDLNSITIPNSVTSIGKKAFSSRPYGEIRIGDYSYLVYVSTIKSVTIGTGVLSIGAYAFDKIEETSETTKVINKPTKVLWLTNTPPTGYANAEGTVNYVANELYTNLDNKTVYPFLSSLFEVGGVKYVPVSPSERTCDAIDCAYDESAEKINIGKSVSYQGIDMTVKNVNPYVCYQNPYIKDVELTFDNHLSDYAFQGCTNITKAVVKNSGNIDNSAFSGCTGISKLSVSNSGNIGKSAFQSCSITNSLNVSNKGNIDESAFSGITGGFTATVNNKGSIASKAFYESTGLMSLDLGTKVTDIGSETFSGCTQLETAKIQNQGAIGNNAFQNCTAMTTATLGNKITSIGSYAFDGCKALTSIVIPNAVTTLGGYAFQNCSSMTSVKMGTGVTTISQYAFSGCSALTDMQIGSKVTIIGYSAFSGCSALPTIMIPQSVTDINNYAFSGCTSLKNVNMEDRKSDKTELTLGSNGNNPLFSSCPLDEVYIGRNISYSKASSSGYSPFYRNTSLRKVTITDKETEISTNEFYGCTNLQDVTIGDGVESFGDWAFSGCSSLKHFSFGMSVETIGREAFSDCTSMVSITSRSPEPPVCGNQALDDINKWTCVLTVPAGNKAAYMAADQWKEFFFVEEGEAVKKYFDVSIDMSEGGKVLVNDKEGNKVSLKKGSDVVLVFTPSEGHSLAQVLINGEEVTSQVIDGCYTMKEISDDIMVKVVFSVNKYKLTYQVDGEEYKSSEVEYGSAITPEAVPTKEGYTFSGWSEIPATMPAHDVTVTGTFNVNQYTITYMIADEVYQTESVDYGSTITPPQAPEREGYTFEWTDVPETMPAHDITIVGSYTSGISTIKADDEDVKWYTLDGKQIELPRKGLNIVRMSKGKTKKVLVK